MNLGVAPTSLWHILAVIPPVVLWRVGRADAERRHITRWHNSVLAVSIWEEVLFRGLVYGAILWLGGNAALAVVGSSLLFGLFHLRNLWWADKRQVLVSCLYTGLIVGPLLGLIRLWSGDIYLCILAHFLQNFMSMRMPGRAIPTDQFLAGKRSNQTRFERFFAGGWFNR